MQTRLEEYLTLADTLPVDLVEGTEKAREKDRRQVTREEKILQQKEEHVSACLHLTHCTSRNLTPVHKRIGWRATLNTASADNASFMRRLSY